MVAASLLELAKSSPSIDIADRVAKSLGMELSELIAKAERVRAGTGNTGKKTRRRGPKPAKS